MGSTSHIRAVLLDMDGTLIDSLGDIANSMNEVLIELGFSPHPLAAYRHMVGDGAAALVARALPEAARESLHADALSRYKSRYSGHLVGTSRPYDGVRAMLDALRERGIPRAILTNKPHQPALELVHALLGDVPFDAILGQRDGVPHKPHPAGALELAARLDVEPATCAFVGDTDVDMKTARNAGMIAVGVSWGFRDRDELWANGAELILDHPMDLIRWLDTRR